MSKYSLSKNYEKKKELKIKKGKRRLRVEMIHNNFSVLLDYEIFCSKKFNVTPSLHKLSTLVIDLECVFRTKNKLCISYT